MLFVEGHEASVDGHALCFEHAHGHLDAGVAHALDAASLHLGEGVDATAHAALHVFADDEIAAGRRVAPVTAWLQ